MEENYMQIIFNGKAKDINNAYEWLLDVYGYGTTIAYILEDMKLCKKRFYKDGHGN